MEDIHPLSLSVSPTIDPYKKKIEYKGKVFLGEGRKNIELTLHFISDIIDGTLLCKIVMVMKACMQ